MNRSLIWLHLRNEEKSPAKLDASGAWPVSTAFKTNTTDMERLTESRPTGAQCAEISRKTTGACEGSGFGGARGGGGPQNAAGAGALGINAKLRAASATERQVERFALQAVARDLLPNSRIALCLRARVSTQLGVQVWKSKEHKTAHYGGLQTCGSVWGCPVCNPKITERRKLEVKQAMDMHRAQGGEVHLLTLTTPHTRHDRLDELQALQAKALQAFLRDFTVKKVFAEMGYIGQIRAFEITHGRKAANNGWHPHYHFLQFVQVKGDAAQLMDWKTRLYLRWDACCQKHGLGSPSFKHGIDLRDGSFADQYIAKGNWGLEDEITKGHSKKGKAGGETPFDLLRAYMADPTDKQAAALFREFVQVTKGKRQLSWSNGLKARFFVDEKTDEELAEEKDERAFLLGQITADQWRDILKVKARATVLELAAYGGWEAISAFLYIIKDAHEPSRLAHDVTPDIVAEARALLLEEL